MASGSPDLIIPTTLYKASADFVKLARRSGVYARIVSNSFPGASQATIEKQLGRKEYSFTTLDVGGYLVSFSPSNHNGSSYVELTVIGRDRSFNY